MVATRTGASSIKDVPIDIVAKLERGEIETVTLAETLAIDFAILASHVFPTLSTEGIACITSVGASGVTVRMRTVGAVLNDFATVDEMETARTHASDIVRGWAAYATRSTLPIDEQLAAVRDFARDHHFGVREWSWLAIRAGICANPLEAIDALGHWAGESDPYVRRFAVEAIRPRGVWATHIPELKADPSLALSILDQVCVDPDDYVLRSVGNWLRDAAKTSPAWVSDAIAGWERIHGPQPSLERLRTRSCSS